MSLLNGLLAGKKPYHPLGSISLKSDVTFYHNLVFKAVTVNLIRARSEYLKLVILFRCRFVYSEKSKLALREDFATLREPFKIGSRGLFWIIMVQNVRHPYFHLKDTLFHLNRRIFGTTRQWIDKGVEVYWILLCTILNLSDEKQNGENASEKENNHFKDEFPTSS